MLSKALSDFKPLIFAVILLISFSIADVLAQVSVRGYYRSNGTYVAPHYRSNPNSTVLDNWSTRGNVNPFTGKLGTKSPAPTASYSDGYLPSSPGASPATTSIPQQPVSTTNYGASESSRWIPVSPSATKSYYFDMESIVYPRPWDTGYKKAWIKESSNKAVQHNFDCQNRLFDDRYFEPESDIEIVWKSVCNYQR